MPAVSLLLLFGSSASLGTLGGSLGGGALGGPTCRKVPSPNGAFRLTEKFVLLLVFSAFIMLCFGAIFFLLDSPNCSATSSSTRPPSSSCRCHHPPRAMRTSRRRRVWRVAAVSGPKIHEDHEHALREAKETLQKLPDKICREIHQDKVKLLLQDKLGRREMGAPGLPDLPFCRKGRVCRNGTQ